MRFAVVGAGTIGQLRAQTIRANPGTELAAVLDVAQANAAKAAAGTGARVCQSLEQLLELLRMSPTLTHVVEVDPSLLSDQDYVARTNPQLAQFLAQHPEVSRNPDFFLFANFPQRPGHRVDGLRRRTNRDDDGAGLSDQQLHREYAQNASITLVLGGGVLALLWLIRLLLENRRWGRLLQLQSDVPPRMILCWFISNSCEAFIGAATIRYFVGPQVRLDRAWRLVCPRVRRPRAPNRP